MAWLFLIIASLFEIAWAVTLKQSHGFTRLWPSLWSFFFMAGGVCLLSFAMKTLPAGTAYAAWTGIGTCGVTIVGILLLGESSSVLRICFIALIVAGVIGLKVTTPTNEPNIDSPMAREEP